MISGNPARVLPTLWRNFYAALQSECKTGNQMPARRLYPEKRRSRHSTHCTKHHLSFRLHRKGGGTDFDMPMEPMYSRFANPTCDAVEQKIAALEGGVGAMLTSSGQAASLLSVLNLCSAGDSIVSVSTIYGGTVNLFGVTLKRFGIECIWVDPLADEETISQAIKPNTKLIFGETIANPALTVFDIEKFAKIAHAHQIPLIVDNTFATPILCRPIEFGADIVIHSTTKYMDGHALQCGGVIVDGGTFDWGKSGKFPDFTEPDESYHGVVYTREFGKMAYIIKARMQLMRDFGCYPAAHSAFLLNLGLETLPVRMKQYCENAMAVAKMLKQSTKSPLSPTPTCRTTPITKWQRSICPTAPAVSFRSRSRAAEKLLSALWTRCSWLPLRYT